MSEAGDANDKHDADDPALDGDGPDSAAMRALLRRALAAPDAPAAAVVAPAGGKGAAAPPSAVLLGVHRKIRKRSGGKFFGDGWSTTQTRINYGMVAVMMLIMLAVTYVALGPMGFSAP